MYKVLIPFQDGESGKPFPVNQGGLSYKVGDTYPAGDFKPTEEHITYLLGSNNKLGCPVIETAPDSEKEKFPCPHCGKEYAGEAALATHIAKKHSDSEKE